MKKISLWMLLLPAFAMAQNTKVIDKKDLPDNSDYQTLRTALKPVGDKLDSLTIAYEDADPIKKADKVFIKTLEENYTAVTEEYKSIVRSFIRKHQRDYISLHVLNQFIGRQFEANEMESLYNSLSGEIKSTDFGILVAGKIASYKNVSIGAKAPEFVQNDPDEKPVALSDFNGKYVLVDFWASWCPSCRIESPYLVKAYNQFKNKNFEIISVSLDFPNGKQAWLNAVEKDGLTWTQVSDLSGWQNHAAQLYLITEIPQNFLLSPNGIIIDKNLKGEKLNWVLTEILGK
jgi:peroxiredoxin